MGEAKKYHNAHRFCKEAFHIKNGEKIWFMNCFSRNGENQIEWICYFSIIQWFLYFLTFVFRFKWQIDLYLKTVSCVKHGKLNAPHSWKHWWWKRHFDYLHSICFLWNTALSLVRLIARCFVIAFISGPAVDSFVSNSFRARIEAPLSSYWSVNAVSLCSGVNCSSRLGLRPFD